MELPATRADGGGKTWRVGTLAYDRPALVNVFFWMLWGDFVLNIMDSGVASNVALLQLRKAGASNFTIGMITGTVTEFKSIFMVAIISTWSDRHRGPLGRRMPFMLWSAPPIAVFLALMGLAPNLAQRVQAAAPGLLGGLSAGGATVLVFALCYFTYRLADMFPQSVYYYLWTDVIPHELMGTFASLFRVVATAGTLLFNLFLLKYSEDRPALICLIAAGMYLVVFVMLCLRVKEGAYPAPEAPPPGAPLERASRNIRRYLRESYSLPFYWKYYLFNLCFMCGFVPFRDFLLLYGKETLKMDLTTYGRWMVAVGVVQIVVFFLVGPMIDRFHPLRAGMFGYVLMCATAALSYLFIGGPTSFGIWVVITFAAVAVYQGATGALGPRLLPKEQYGQFCSASAMVWHLGLMVLKPTLGKLIDLFGNPVTFAWFFGFSAVGIGAMFLVYVDWKRLGGDESYRPPVVLDDEQAVGGLEVVPGERV
jgi:Na+/melibiose symporter-like transporter